MTPPLVSVYNIPMVKQSSRPRPTSSARRPTTDSARNQMMDILARRDHSEKELREKLNGKFPSDEVESAIEFAKSKGWIPESEEDQMRLSQKIADDLKRKGKGHEYINQYLEQKGLAPVPFDPAEELEKARQLVENKFSDMKQMDQKQKAKAGRFLSARGFDLETVRKVIYE